MPIKGWRVVFSTPINRKQHARSPSLAFSDSPLLAQRSLILRGASQSHRHHLAVENGARRIMMKTTSQTWRLALHVLVGKPGSKQCEGLRGERQGREEVVSMSMRSFVMPSLRRTHNEHEDRAVQRRSRGEEGKRSAS